MVNFWCVEMCNYLPKLINSAFSPHKSRPRTRILFFASEARFYMIGYNHHSTKQCERVYYFHERLMSISGITQIYVFFV